MQICKYAEYNYGNQQGDIICKINKYNGICCMQMDIGTKKTVQDKYKCERIKKI